MKRKIKLIIAILFIITISALYSLMLNQDANGQSDAYLKLGIIFICFITSLINLEFNLETNLMRLAILLTLISDYFLIFTPHYIIGLATFCLVQTLYFGRLLLDKKRIALNILMRISIFLLISLALIIIVQREYLLIILLVYYAVNIFINMIDSFILCTRNQWYFIFGIAFGLFICCDTLVFFNNASKFITLNEMFNGLVDFAVIGMWLFYVPSQILLVTANYLIPERKKIKIKEN